MEALTAVRLKTMTLPGKTGKDFISKYSYSINRVEGNLLHRTICISNIKVKV